MNIFEMNNQVQNNLSETLVESNQTLETLNNQKQPTVILQGGYMFQDEESMDTLLNKIGLAVQRKGGK